MPRSREDILPGSLSNAKCAKCGEVFSVVSNFDKHRTHDRKQTPICLDPESVGLTLSDKQIWITAQEWYKSDDSS